MYFFPRCPACSFVVLRASEAFQIDFHYSREFSDDDDDPKEAAWKTSIHISPLNFTINRICLVRRVVLNSTQI